jgi:hypothetical protein
MWLLFVVLAEPLDRFDGPIGLALMRYYPESNTLQLPHHLK